MSTKAATKKTYTVMHSKGEVVDGKKLRPYDTFKAVPTEELDTKVKRNYLFVDGQPAKASKRSSKKK